MSDFTKPMDLDRVTVIFGAGRKEIPPEKDIPEEFWKDYGPAEKWRQFQSTWFCCGVKNLVVTPKPGIDKSKALAHLRAINCSFEPSHEHKMAAFAWLASRWFEDVAYQRADR